MKYFLLLLSFIFILNISMANEVSDFSRYMQQHNTEYLQDENEFLELNIQVKKEFEAHQKKVQAAYREYKKAIGAIWGEKQAVISSPDTWAEYKDNFNQRHVVDFKNGMVTVEVVLDQKDKSKNKINKRLENAIVNTVTSQADSRSIIQLAAETKKQKNKKPVDVDTKVVVPKMPGQPSSTNTLNTRSGNEAVLAGQLKTRKGKPVTSQNARQFAREKIKKPASIRKIKGADGNTRKVARISFPLIPDHLKKRAVRFKGDVDRYSQRFGVSKKLVYAVIETESYFNPVARSNAPAYGLMQLVPHYGAREAYRFVHNKDKVVSAHYLYNPGNNIQLGSAYLHVLHDRRMEGIKNDQSRLWCTIAAYNTGPSNVFRAVIGKYRRSTFRKYRIWKAKAIREINKLSSDQLYALLRKQLPFAETRHYIKKVRSRMGKYASL